MFFTKNRVIEKFSKENVKVVEVYKRSGHTFQLFCDARKAAGTKGMNVNYCLFLLTPNGFVPLVDNRMLDIPEMNYVEGENDRMREDIKNAFAEFKGYVEVMV